MRALLMGVKVFTTVVFSVLRVVYRAESEAVVRSASFGA